MSDMNPELLLATGLITKTSSSKTISVVRSGHEACGYNPGAAV